MKIDFSTNVRVTVKTFGVYTFLVADIFIQLYLRITQPFKKFISTIHKLYNTAHICLL